MASPGDELIDAWFEHLQEESMEIDLNPLFEEMKLPAARADQVSCGYCDALNQKRPGKCHNCGAPVVYGVEGARCFGSKGITSTGPK